jgi:hypothetical protein
VEIFRGHAQARKAVRVVGMDDSGLKAWLDALPG